MKIIQLVNGYSKGDGVGNVITAIDRLLSSKGYSTEIYNQILTFSDLNNPDFQGDNIVLYHVALSVDPLVSYLKCKKILLFHNITDPELLIGAGLQQIRNGCSAGLYDVRSLSKYFDSAIVFSDYSKKTLVDCGWDEKKVYEMPIIVRFDNFSQKYDDDLTKKYSDEYTNILFTGRIFPNKKQEDIIYAFYEYKKKYNIKSRLFIVGSVGNESYYRALQNLVRKLNLEKDVIFTGRAPFTQYLAYYRLADVFLCMSAHEGFCIPLVEALYFDLPIVAINSTAIPDTLGGSGILLNSREASDVAMAINRIVTDDKYRMQILAGERKRLEELQPEIIEGLYLDVLDRCITNTQREPQYKHIDKTRVLFDDIAIPDAIYEKKNVIYGFGAAGNRLHEYLKKEGVTLVAICDQNKAGTSERNIEIISPMTAFEKYRNENFIISIQDKKIIKTVIGFMIKNGIRESDIYIFDEIKDEIV